MRAVHLGDVRQPWKGQPRLTLAPVSVEGIDVGRHKLHFALHGLLTTTGDRDR